MNVNLKVDKARIGDVPTIQQLVNYFADKGDMLPRALSEIYENIRDYFVVRDSNQVIGCTALHVSWSDLAEIRSLAVNENSQGQGIGSSLVLACLNEAKELALPNVFCLTRRPAFFEKLGFNLIDKAELPHKVWAECFRCPKFPNCDEVALTRHI
jgi:amino-acid N-acetyltransferase